MRRSWREPAACRNGTRRPARPRGIEPPGTYDPESGRPWTRRRDLYPVHVMSAQWAVLRQKLIARAFPNG
ncbi:hypothetical protein [Streptomyces sp. NPDC013457]|uniref:hypothetical protein n=1 Tax=Streptomyces sp. NPDC013457 TaxID=3364866 RepID=UPI0036F9D1F1